MLATCLSLGLKRAKTAHVPSDLSEVSPLRLLSRLSSDLSAKFSHYEKVGSLRFQPSWCSSLGQKSRRRLNCSTLDSSNVSNFLTRINIRLCISNIRLRRPLGLLFWAKLPVRAPNAPIHINNNKTLLPFQIPSSVNLNTASKVFLSPKLNEKQQNVKFSSSTSPLRPWQSSSLTRQMHKLISNRHGPSSLNLNLSPSIILS
ncbi:MAG: hypothetical protein ACTS5F_00830 [Candidatus Hodgkinia cicadicola]